MGSYYRKGELFTEGVGSLYKRGGLLLQKGWALITEGGWALITERVSSLQKGWALFTKGVGSYYRRDGSINNIQFLYLLQPLAVIRREAVLHNGSISK